MIEISVVIPTYNRKELLTKCLISLFNQNFDKNKYEIIVVDDGSTDGTGRIIKKLVKISPVRLRYFKQGNRGAAAARNLGVGKSQAPIIAFTDDDCIVSENWLKSINLSFQQHPGITARAGFGNLHPTDFIQQDPQGRFSDPHSPACPASNNFALYKETFLQIGGFDTNLRVNEDNDLFIRLLKENHHILVNKGMKIKHKSRTKLRDIFHQNYRYGVEDVLVFKKNFPNRLVLRILNTNLLDCKLPFAICIKLKPFNIFFASLLFLPILPLLPITLFLFTSIYFIRLCLRQRCFSPEILLQMYLIRFGRIIGNIVGSFRYRFIFYGP